MRRRHNPKGSILVITGTPGSGKTTLAEALHRRLKNSNMISVNSLIREKKFFISREKDGTLIADMGKLGRHLRQEARNTKGMLILEGHLLCEIGIPGATAIVIREHLNTLEKRLLKRGYQWPKIRDNLISEAIDYSGSTARMNYKKVYEIIPGRNTVSIAEKIARGKSVKLPEYIDMLQELASFMKNGKNITV
jgi:broad-specificity NMP kinase